MRLVADDNAVITVDPDPQSGGWAVNCTMCGYVMSDSDAPDSKGFVEENAAGHHDWHNHSR